MNRFVLNWTNNRLWNLYQHDHCFSHSKSDICEIPQTDHVLACCSNGSRLWWCCSGEGPTRVCDSQCGCGVPMFTTVAFLIRIVPSVKYGLLLRIKQNICDIRMNRVIAFLFDKLLLWNPDELTDFFKFENKFCGICIHLTMTFLIRKWGCRAVYMMLWSQPCSFCDWQCGCGYRFWRAGVQRTLLV